MTREELEDRVPLKHHGPGGCNGVDHDETYAQVEAVVRGAVAAERERCARVAEGCIDPEWPGDVESETARHIARTIRAGVDP